jgi:hypothetical protein
MSIRVDFEGVPDPSEFSVLPAGEYLTRVVEAEEKIGKQSGNEYLALKYQVIGGKYDGTIIYDNMFYTELSLPRLKFMLREFGFNVEGSIEFDGSALVGKPMALTTTVEHEEDYKGRLDAEGHVKIVKKCKVEFVGFRKPTDEEVATVAAVEDLPF